MKVRFSAIILSVLILSLALQTITLPARAQSEPDDSQAEIENLVDLPEIEQPAYPDRDAQLYPEDRFENMPPELADRYLRHSETGENPEYIPPSPEIIAETQAQVNAFDCTTVTDVTQIECEALVDLYQSTNGAGWAYNYNWLQSTTVSTWFGVVVDNGVTKLILSSNQMNGSIPSTLVNLTNLEVLYLNHNQLKGSIPSTLVNLTNLRVLFLYYNQLTGSIPEEFGNLSNLVNLYMHHNQLTGSIPSSLGSLSVLTGLHLHDNQLTGSIPAELGNLFYLKELDLHNNLLTGSIPTELGNLPNMLFLSLQDNLLTGSIPAELGNLSNMLALYLNKNQLTGSIPAELGSLSVLTGLYLHDNLLTGSIPAELGNLSNLQGLYLRHNLLTGSIPTELGNLSILLYLYLQDNLLTGNIPSSLGNFPLLRTLDLSGNQLTGRIPSSLGNLSLLRSLYLDHNQLTGSIPAELGQLTNLNFMGLNENLFEGDLPNSFVNLVNLCDGVDEENGCWEPESGLDLGYNRLNVPQEEPVASFLELKDPDWYLTQAVEVTIPGESGGIIQSRDGMTKIEIPAGAYNGEMIFLFILHSSPGHPYDGLMEANNNFELITSVIGEAVSNFNLPLTITINYTHQQIVPIIEDSLNLYHWKSDQSAWNNAISACPGGEYIRNPQEDWLSLPLCELGEFALLGETKSLYLPLVRR